MTIADCSKTEVFLAEWERMCDNTDCECCAAMGLTKRCGVISCNFAIMRNKEDAIKIVQKWSYEHPAPKQKTYADDFFEKYPNAKRHENGRPLAYRCDVYGCECNYKKAPEVLYWRGKKGIDDCLMCWNEPYKE